MPGFLSPFEKPVWSQGGRVVKIVIIIPTYNENDNIGNLAAELERYFPLVPHDMHILVVDDNSPDGTAQTVREMQKKNGRLHLLTGTKAGLGAAYIRGMNYALDALEADAVFEMDADFSHKPADILPMIAAIEDGADFVIGSRYVPGGKIPDNWGALRKSISRCGNLVARYLAGLYGVRDCTAGFRAIRSRVLKQINLDDLKVQGYAFQVALLERALALGAKVREVPVEFVDRTQGESKLGLSDISEFILHAWKIRVHKSRSFIKFSIVGASGLGVNLACFALLLHFGMNKYLASPIAIEVSILWNFFFNSQWTFRSREVDGGVPARGLKFNFVSLLALGVSYSTFLVLNHLFPNVVPYIHQVISVLPAVVINYALNSCWTFREIKKPA
jgi:dolichol-phosphate mannosyltransferase